MKTAYQILNEAKLMPRVLDWGLHGELVRRNIKKAKDVFVRHVEAIAKVLREKPEVIRDMMDSKVGRHYADSLVDAILAQPTPANVMRHPWIKKQLKHFLKGYDPEAFAGTVSEGTVEINYVQGMKSTKKRKKFKSEKDFDKWMDKNEDDIEILGVRRESVEPDFDIDPTLLTELSKSTEYAKAQMRLQSFWDKTVGAGKPMEKFNNMVNLRTKKMTKLLKVKLWYEVLEDENYHDLAKVAYDRMKALGG